MVWWVSEKRHPFWGGKKFPSLRTFSVWKIETVYFHFFFFNWTFTACIQVASFLEP